MSTDYTKAEQAGMDNFKNMSPENKVPSLFKGLLEYFKDRPPESINYNDLMDYIRGWERGFEISYRRLHPKHVLPEYQVNDNLTIEMSVIDPLMTSQLFMSLHGRLSYYRAENASLKERLEGDGWRSEALYLRHRANKEAAQFAVENE